MVDSGKHFCHLTVDFNMELDEEIDRLKKDFAGKKHYLIETYLGYTPSCVTSFI